MHDVKYLSRLHPALHPAVILFMSLRRSTGVREDEVAKDFDRTYRTHPTQRWLVASIDHASRRASPVQSCSVLSNEVAAPDPGPRGRLIPYMPPMDALAVLRPALAGRY